MKTSFFDANTFGLGELITQKKIFRVPSHQRSYSWTAEAVSTFLSDIENAFQNKSSEYFVGLVVIQGPVDGEWILLDGQQRLTTITLVYAAIRNWLGARDLTEDAKQIENEFLGVRRLGGDYSSRMLLNHENQGLLDELVVDRQSGKQILDKVRDLPKRSSNRMLLEAAVECQRWVDRLVKDSGASDEIGAQTLFRLAGFVETKIKVVSVEVSSEVDAFTLFESLNDRGLELSALDLVKNYTFSKAGPSAAMRLEQLWGSILEHLEEANRDDFLKVFWTARFGVIQKTHLFRSLRNKYQSPEDVVALVDALRHDAQLLTAIDDAEHAIWGERSMGARESIYVLNALGSKQARPVVLSGLHHLADEELTDLMRALIAVVVRYQIIGKGRTGVMEKVFGQLCQALEARAITTGQQIRRFLRDSDLHTDDFRFETEFAEHRDTKLSRFAYFLAAIELHCRQKSGIAGDVSIQQLLSQSALVSVAVLMDATSFSTDDDEIFSIGNYLLVEDEIAKRLTTDRDALLASAYSCVRQAGPLPPTRELPFFIQQRAHQMAAQANEVWSIQN